MSKSRPLITHHSLLKERLAGRLSLTEAVDGLITIVKSAVGFVNRLIDEGRLPRGMGEGEFRHIKLHRIIMEEPGESFRASGTLNTEYQSFERLHKLGQRATRRFCDAHFDDIGHRSTIDAGGLRAGDEGNDGGDFVRSFKALQ